MSADNLELLAERYRYDNSDDTEWFADSACWCWEYVKLEPGLLEAAFADTERAQRYIDKEVCLRKQDDLPYQHYLDMLRNGATGAVTATLWMGEYRLWDGYHRTAISAVRSEKVLVLLGRRKQD